MYRIVESLDTSSDFCLSQPFSLCLTAHEIVEAPIDSADFRNVLDRRYDKISRFNLVDSCLTGAERMSRPPKGRLLTSADIQLAMIWI